MAPWSGNQGSQEPDQIVVHVPWVSQSGRTRGHNGRNEGVDFSVTRAIDIKSVGDNAIQGLVIQHNNSIGIVSESLEGKDGVVRGHNHITLSLILGRKDRISLKSKGY